MAAAAEAIFDAGFDQDATAWIALLPPAPVTSDPALIKRWIEGSPWHKGAFGIDPGWLPDSQELLMIRAEIEQDRESAPASTAGYNFGVYPDDAAANADKAFTWLNEACEKAQIVLGGPTELDADLRAALDDMIRDPFRFQKKCGALKPAQLNAITAAYLRAHPEEQGALDHKRAVARSVHDLSSVPADDLLSSPFAELALTLLPAVANSSIDAAAATGPQEKPHLQMFREALGHVGVDLDVTVISPEFDLALRQTIALAGLYQADMEAERGQEPETPADFRGMLSPENRISVEDVLHRAAVIACSWKVQVPVAALGEALLEMRLAQAWRMIEPGEALPSGFCDMFLQSPHLALADLLDDVRMNAKKANYEPENPSI